MNIEEIAKTLCEKTYMKLCDPCEPEVKPGYSLKEYWEINKEYFAHQVEVYLAVKKCLE